MPMAFYNAENDNNLKYVRDKINKTRHIGDCDDRLMES